MLSDQAKPRRGRPPLPPGKRRDAVLRVRCTAKELRRWREHAESQGVSLAELTRDVLWASVVRAEQLCVGRPRDARHTLRRLDETEDDGQ